MNKNFIIGTAGHIDHGKTSLIRALTGIETDRFEEEKKRGITIDLGFAYFDLPSGVRAGIIDVPGHEKFIKNMLAGISGVDLFLLVIAADEGVMPQTKEHLDILEILGIEEGIIVITKTDLVYEDMLELVVEDIRESVGGSFLENSDIVFFSAKTGYGIKELVGKLEEKSKTIKKKSEKGPFRMSVDRVFTLSGHGTIVTGTLIEGSIQLGDKAIIYPQEKHSKVRSIQVHGKTESIAYAGQRTALNLPELKTSDIRRGDVLAAEGSITTSYIVDCKLKLLKDSKRSIENWTRLRLYHGAKEILCRCVLLDKDIINSGDEEFVQLRLEEPYSFKYNDRFVVRFYSPVETIGGGIILNPDSQKHKRHDEDLIEQLKVKAEGDKRDVLISYLSADSKLFVKRKDILSILSIDTREFESIIGDMLAENIIYAYKDLEFIFFEKLESIESTIIEILNKFHRDNPYKQGMNKSEIKTNLTKKYDLPSNKHFDFIIQEITNNRNIILDDKYIKLSSFEIVFSEAIMKAINKSIEELDFQNYKTDDFDEILRVNGIKKQRNDVIEYLISSEKVVRVAEGIYFTKAKIDILRDKIVGHFNNNEYIEINDVKEMTRTSRKYIIPILEYFDSIKMTKRQDGKRVLIVSKND